MKRSANPALPPVEIDRHGGGPLHRQICDSLRNSITSGALAAGRRVPSTRQMGQRLGVSRNTVLSAYETLASEGWLSGRIGSGTRVRGRLPAVSLPDPRRILRGAHYPLARAGFRDPEGNGLYVHR